MLGQSGCEIVLSGEKIVFDPYLSNSVQKLDAPDLCRLVPIANEPKTLDDIDWVMLTHAHIDHCDPETIPDLAAANPNAKFS